MQINIEKRHFLIILGIMFLLAGGFVYAYGTSTPSVVGHSAGELELPSDICRSSGSACPSRLSSCSFKTTKTSCGRTYCPSGYKITGKTPCGGWGSELVYCAKVSCS